MRVLIVFMAGEIGGGSPHRPYAPPEVAFGGGGAASAAPPPRFLTRFPPPASTSRHHTATKSPPLRLSASRLQHRTFTGREGRDPRAHPAGCCGAAASDGYRSAQHRRTDERGRTDGRRLLQPLPLARRPCRRGARLRAGRLGERVGRVANRA